jgi:ABC-type phosphate transport system substrate-binding protein
MRQDTLTAAIDSGYVLELPLFAARFVLIYSLPTLGVTDQELVVDYDLLSDIWQGKIISWDHPRFTELNPALSAAGKLPSGLNITRVVVTSGEREAESESRENQYAIHSFIQFNLLHHSSLLMMP